MLHDNEQSRQSSQAIKMNKAMGQERCLVLRIKTVRAMGDRSQQSEDGGQESDFSNQRSKGEKWKLEGEGRGSDQSTINN